MECQGRFFFAAHLLLLFKVGFLIRFGKFRSAKNGDFFSSSRALP